MSEAAVCDVVFFVSLAPLMIGAGPTRRCARRLLRRWWMCHMLGIEVLCVADAMAALALGVVVSAVPVRIRDGVPLPTMPAFRSAFV